LKYKDSNYEPSDDENLDHDYYIKVEDKLSNTFKEYESFMNQIKHTKNYNKFNNDFYKLILNNINVEEIFDLPKLIVY